MSVEHKPVKVSIIIPIYNVENFIAKCLDSCINQTLLDIEIICIDDESPDRSGEIAELYAALDNRVKVIHKKNEGVSAARNTGLKAADGEYIMFLDSDDYIMPDACESVYNAAVENYPDIIVHGGHAIPEYPVAPAWIRGKMLPEKKSYKEFKAEALFKRRGATPFVWLQAYSAEFLKSINASFPEGINFGEDLIFQFTVFPFAKRIEFVEDRVSVYRWFRKGSYMNLKQQDMDGKISRHIKNVEYIAKHWQQHGLLDKYGKEFFNWTVEFLAADLLKKELKNKKEYTEEYKRLAEGYGLTKYRKNLKLVNRVKWTML